MYLLYNVLKSVPGLADVGLLDGDEDDSPELHPDVWRGPEKVSDNFFYYA